MEELYWITRLDAVHAVICFLVAAGVIVSIALFLWTIGEDDETSAPVKPKIKCFAILGLVGVLGSVFVPTTKEALVIYGVGGTIDYIKQDTVAQKLPQKAIIALDKYLDESINNN